MPSFMLRGYKRPREVVDLALGKLEREVMNIAWQRTELCVRDVYEVFQERIAYTTLMTTLHCLYRKGVLDRSKKGRAFIYSPRFTPLELEQGIAKDVIEGLMDRAFNGVEPLLACIVETVTEQDRTYLDALERFIRQKKRDLRNS
jgi:predicted transcriptional regulator